MRANGRRGFCYFIGHRHVQDKKGALHWHCGRLEGSVHLALLYDAWLFADIKCADRRKLATFWQLHKRNVITPYASTCTIRRNSSWRDLYSSVFYRKRPGRGEVLMLLLMCSDTSANEDRSFRNHIRWPKRDFL
jgi:hypothetical protein